VRAVCSLFLRDRLGAKPYVGREETYDGARRRLPPSEGTAIFNLGIFLCGLSLRR
jgi:hypothetical protein